jgi:serine/threonine protein phosphatase PrpC
VVTGRWQIARHCSVIGAAHQRQQRVCQDASLQLTLRGRGSEPLLLLAVADGHGGSRYHRSEVGSRLACEQAAEAVAEALGRAALHDRDSWQRQLGEQLPAAIQQRWLAAIEADWRLRPESGGQSFSPLSYGSTLGLVLLAPDWWGCTGLGDWDLVLVSPQGAELVSQELDHGSAAEATGSLCLADAAARWSERALLRPITAGAGDFSLVLCTDGIRKSCVTDVDFLQLCQQLIALHDPAELERGLAQISAAGSGDDLSVAIGRWISAPAGQPRTASGPDHRSPPAAPQAHGRRWPWLISGALMGLAGFSLIVLATLLQGRRLARPPQPPPTARPALWIEVEAMRLCRQPELIPGTLAQRNSLFSGLTSGQLQPAPLLAAAASDPLSALIAASQPPPAGEPGSLPNRLCPPLRLALDQRWQQQRQAGGRMPGVRQPAPASQPPASSP